MTDRSRYIARVQFLGAQRIEIGNEEVTPDAERLFAMIVRLSAPMGRITSRQTMMDTLWPGSDEANARHNLRQTVYKAREIGLVVESGEDGLRLDPRHWSCDWDDPEGDVDGEWLANYEPEFSRDLASWVTSQRIGVHALIRPRIIRSLQKARASGDLIRADRYATQLLQIDELNEEATLTRAELMAMQGAKVDALRLLDTYLNEIGRLGAGKDASLPAHLLRRRIAEKLPVVAYQSGEKHHRPLIGRVRESKRLIAGLFDARAGRGGAVLLHGPEGSGKSRLLHEVKKSAVLQGMRVLAIAVTRAPSAIAFATLRCIATRMLQLPGAMGISPEALATIRGWITSDNRAPDDCPLFEIEDLFAAVAEETALLLMVENCSEIDAESLTGLDRLYRRGVGRYHGAVLTTCTRQTPTDGGIELREIERVSLRPMTLTEVRDVILAYAAVEMPRATSDQVNCAAAFAEGVPMYGIEMLGLMLDEGSPDVIPWRVQVAVERNVRGLDELQMRLLWLSAMLGPCARQELIASTLRVHPRELSDATDALEIVGLISCEDGALRPSRLNADTAGEKLTATTKRLDSLVAARELEQTLTRRFIAAELYACAKMYTLATEESIAERIVGEKLGELVRFDTAESIVFELSKLRLNASNAEFIAMLDEAIAQIRYGSDGQRLDNPQSSSDSRATSLPHIATTAVALEHCYSTVGLYDRALAVARDPGKPTDRRLSEAVMALFVASNLTGTDTLDEAHSAVNAIRHARDINPFDLERADLIYFASKGDRVQALESAQRLVSEARVVRDVHLACRGFRNAAEACSTFGDLSTAQALLLESRNLASRLKYAVQVVSADIRLADLCTEVLDIEGASRYLASASSLITKHSLKAPMIVADFTLQTCWSALTRGDTTSAQRASRELSKLVSGSTPGTATWCRVGASLATHRGAETRERRRDFQILRASVGSRPFYANEHFSMGALVLYSKERGDHAEVCRFVRSQFDRLEASGRKIWPFILANLA